MTATGYSDQVLVDSEWAKAHLTDPKVRFVEVDVDTTAYEQSHIPGAVGWNWTSQLADGIRRDIAGREEFSTLLQNSGIGPDTTIVLYGDNNNWFAAWAYWQLKLYGHKDVRILNGGRRYWLDNGLPLSVDVVSHAKTSYQLPKADYALRAFRDDILPKLGQAGFALVDVRSPAEFNGEVIAPPGMTETAQRAGHIPGAASIPWAQTVREDGTFKGAEDLRTLYEGKGRHARQGRDRLLPHRRALVALVVRAPRAARLQARPQLRRLVDRVGQHGQHADREGRLLPPARQAPPPRTRGARGVPRQATYHPNVIATRPQPLVLDARPWTGLARLERAPWLDDVEPADVAEAFRDLPGLALLESARPQAGPRWTYLSADPPVVLREPTHGGDPFGAARGLLGRLETAPPCVLDAAKLERIPPFLGGLVGYLAYELGAILEPRVVPVPGDQDLPLLQLALHDWAVAWDVRSGRAFLGGRALDGDADRLNARLAGVRERLRDARAGFHRSAGSSPLPGSFAFRSNVAGPPTRRASSGSGPRSPPASCTRRT